MVRFPSDVDVVDHGLSRRVYPNQSLREKKGKGNRTKPNKKCARSNAPIYFLARTSDFQVYRCSLPAAVVSTSSA